MKKWWHKLTGRESFRVRYENDGLITRKMDYSEAKAYAAIFKGEIIFDPDIEYESPP